MKPLIIPRYATRKEVDAHNSYRLGQLNADTHVYEARDMPGWDEEIGEHFPVAVMVQSVERLVAQKSVTLKVKSSILWESFEDNVPDEQGLQEGAQVMLIKASRSIHICRNELTVW